MFSCWIKRFSIRKFKRSSLWLKLEIYLPCIHKTFTVISTNVYLVMYTLKINLWWFSKVILCLEHNLSTILNGLYEYSDYSLNQRSENLQPCFTAKFFYSWETWNLDFAVSMFSKQINCIREHFHIVLR